jgi:hypothetical protein
LAGAFLAGAFLAGAGVISVPPFENAATPLSD